jgi:hypothetical protein
VFDHAPVLRGDALLLVVLTEAVVNLGGLPAGLGQVILEEGDLVVVAEVLKQRLEGLNASKMNKSFVGKCPALHPTVIERESRFLIPKDASWNQVKLSNWYSPTPMRDHSG